MILRHSYHTLKGVIFLAILVNIENEKVIYTCCIESDEPGIDDEYFVAEEDELK